MAKRKKKMVYLPNIAATASTGDCTGLMPTPARSEEQREAYRFLISTALPQGDK